MEMTVNEENEEEERLQTRMGAISEYNREFGSRNASDSSYMPNQANNNDEDDWIREVEEAESVIPVVTSCFTIKTSRENTTRKKIHHAIEDLLNDLQWKCSTKQRKRQQIHQTLVEKGFTSEVAAVLTTPRDRNTIAKSQGINNENQLPNNNQNHANQQNAGRKNTSLDRKGCSGPSRTLSSIGGATGVTEYCREGTDTFANADTGIPARATTGRGKRSGIIGTSLYAEDTPSHLGKEGSNVQTDELHEITNNIIQNYQCYEYESCHTFLASPDGLPTTVVKINGEWHNMKLDTCAGCSIASSRLSELGEYNESRTNITHIEGVGGNQLQVVGTKRFKMETVNGDILWVNMLVVQGLKEDFLLGTDFFAQQNAIMDFEQRIMICDTEHGKKIAVPFECSRLETMAKVMDCRVAQDTALSGESRGFTRLHIDCEDGEQVMFIPVATVTNGLLLAPTVTKVKNKQIIIPILNLTSTTVKLPDKQQLGTWIPIGKDIELLECDNLLTPESICSWLDTLQQTDVPLNGEEGIKLNNLNQQQQTLLRKLLRCYPVLVEKKEGCPPLTRTGVEHVINTGNAAPIFQKRLRHAASENETIRTHVDKMLKDGVIEEGCGPWGFPVVLVKKKDGETRFCIDYRALNDITVKDVYPLPRIDETIESVGGARWFSTLDLKAGYWQLGVRERDKDKTAFITRQGLFRFTRMPFGLCNAPGTFQRMMDCVLRGLLWVCCLVYLDDVIVYTKGSFEQHLLELAVVFERLSVAGLTLKLSKCTFGSKALEFLGHLLTPEGIQPLTRIVEAVKNFPSPTNPDEVRRFVHLAGYYRKFIPQFGTKMASVTKLLRKNYEWEWGKDQQNAFQAMKDELTSKPLLIYPDFNKPFILVTDASTVGLGASLMQDQGKGLQPVAFASKVNNTAQSKYSITKLECLAMVWAIKTFRPYLYGRRFTVVTDHAALKWLMSSNSLTGMLHRWAITLQEYDFDIQYRPGSTNVVADALSRAPIGSPDEIVPYESKAWEKALRLEENDETGVKTLRLRMVIQLTNEVIAKAQNESKMCEKLKKVGVYMGMTILEYNGLLSINSGEGRKVVLPPVLWPIAFKECHGSIWNGHLRLQKTLERLRQSYWWPNMERITQAWIVSCQDCGSRKARARQVIPPLRPLGIGFVGERWLLDIAGPFPVSNEGNKYAIAAIDWVSKYAVGMAIPSKSASHVSKFLLTEVVLKFGPFRTLICDNAPEFVGNTVDLLVDMLQAKQHSPVPYRPNFVGLIERFNRTWKDMVAMYVSRDHSDWDYWLPIVLYAYNSAVQSSTNFQPAQLMMGKKLPTPSELLRVPTHRIHDITEYHKNLLSSMRYNEQVARGMIARAQERQSLQYNKQVRHKFNFKIGDFVWVHLPPRGQGTTKFKHQWRGPAEIKDDVGFDNRCVFFLDNKQDIIVHISQLVPYHSKDYMRIMDEVVNDWSEERMVIENTNKEDGIAWLYDNESQENSQDLSSNSLRSISSALEWNEADIQTEHTTRDNHLFKETRRKYKRDSRTGRQEPWYEIEFYDTNNRKTNRWLTRSQYEDLWKQGWNDQEIEVQTDTNEGAHDSSETHVSQSQQ